MMERVYDNTGILLEDCATVSIYLEYPKVDNHHLSIRITHPMFHSFWSHPLLHSFYRSMEFVLLLSHSGRAFIHPCNLHRFLQLDTTSYHLTIMLGWSSWNGSVQQIPFRLHERCGIVLPMGCHHSSCTISPDLDYWNFEMYLEAVIKQLQR